MSSVVVQEVKTKAQLKKFIEFGNELYKDCEQYAYPLFFDEMNFFNPKKNKNFSFCEQVSYLAYQDGKIVGRISGLINHAYNKKANVKHLRFHHYDVIDNIEVSKALFDAIGAWGKSKGMEEFDGPIGMTDLDKQGMLIEGYDLPGMFITIYNYPYYVEHLKQLGFQKDVDWIEKRVFINNNLDPRVARIANAVAERRKFRVLKFKNKEEIIPYIHQAFKVYNEAFAPLHGVVELHKDQVEMYVDQYIGMMNFRYVQIVVNDKNEAIGFAALAPSLLEATRKAKGRLFPFGWYHLLYALKHPKILDMYFVAVKPEYQGLGVNALMLIDALKCAQEDGVLFAETGPELEDNYLVQGLWDNFEHENVRKRRCFIRKI